jgi:hypothetical protein
MIRLLASQLELNAYADGSDEAAMARDRQLVERLAALQGLDLPRLPTPQPAKPQGTVTVLPVPGSQGGEAPGGPGRRKRPNEDEMDELVKALGGPA